MKARALTFVQKRIAEVRAERLALLERAGSKQRASRARASAKRESEALVSGEALVSSDGAPSRLTSHERPLLRGEVEPEVVVAEDGTIRLAPLEWSTVASDGTEQ